MPPALRVHNGRSGSSATWSAPSKEWEDEFQEWKAMRSVSISLKSKFRQARQNKKHQHESTSCINTNTNSPSDQKAKKGTHSSSAAAPMTAQPMDLIPENRDDDRLRYLDDSPIPHQYVTYIQEAFGTKDDLIDLYRDVLGVSRNANDRDLRIAYFKRGRDVLSTRVTKLKNDANAKKRFQAVCMAYEILSTPELRAFYDQYGLVSSPPSSSASAPLSRLGPKPVASHQQSERTEAKSTPEPSERTLPQNSKKIQPKRKPAIQRPASNCDSAKSTQVTSERTSPPQTSPRSLKPKSKPIQSVHEELPKVEAEVEGPSSAPAVVVAPTLGGRHDHRDLTTATSHKLSRSASRSIRWNEEVEELIYEKDPEELLGHHSSQSAAGAALGVILGDPPAETVAPKMLRKVKAKAVLEAQELDRQLEAMHEAQKGNNFVSTILDDLEASLDGLESSVEEFVRFAISAGSESQEQQEENGALLQQPEQPMRSNGETLLTGLEDQFVDDTSISTAEFSSLQQRLPPASSSSSSSERDNHVGTHEGVSEMKSPTPTASNAVTKLQSSPNFDEEKTCNPLALENSRNSSQIQPPSIPSNILTAFRPDNVDVESMSLSYTSKDLLLGGKPSACKNLSAKPITRLSKFRKSKQKAKQLSDTADDDLAESLFDDLTKPVPENISNLSNVAITSSPPFNSLQSTMHFAADVPVDDNAKELFRDLTKPPPSGYEKDSVTQITTLFNRKVNDKPTPRRKMGRRSKCNRDQYEFAEAFDPFGLTDASESSSRPRRPPDCIVANEDDDDTTYNSMSTMTMSVATAVFRERFLARDSAWKARAERERGHQELLQTDDEERATETAAAGDKITVEKSSPVSVRSFDEETFDLISSVRARGKGSSRSTSLACRHASKLTYQQERGLRSFCTSMSEGAAGAASEVCDPQPLPPGENDDDDFVSRIMTYMVAFTNEVDKIGYSVSNLVSAAVSVPEEDVQEILTVLSQEMDSTSSNVGSTNSATSKKK